MRRKPAQTLNSSSSFSTLRMKEEPREIGILFDVSEQFGFPGIRHEERSINQGISSFNQQNMARVYSQPYFKVRGQGGLYQTTPKNSEQRSVFGKLTVGQISSEFLTIDNQPQKSEDKRKNQDQQKQTWSNILTGRFQREREPYIPEQIQQQQKTDERPVCQKSGSKIIQNSIQNQPKQRFLHHIPTIQQPILQAIQPEMRAGSLPQPQPAIQSQPESILAEIQPEELPQPSIPRRARLRKTYQKLPRNTRANPIIEIISLKSTSNLSNIQSPRHRRTQTDVPEPREHQINERGTQEATREQKAAIVGKLRSRIKKNQ